MTLQKTFLAPVLVAALALVAIVGFSAFAHADSATVITPTIVNGSNATITSAVVGTPLQANVLVASSSTTTVPTGTVNFNLYSGASCTGTPTTQSGVTLSATGSAQSATTTLPLGGLSYSVSYSGDTLNTGGTSGCVSVSATQTSPTITTSLSNSNVLAGSSVNDTATLNSASSTAGGSVTYTAYTNNACTLGAMSAGSKTVTNGAVPASNSVLFNTPGTYYWQAVYSGDSVNAAATSTCGSEVLNVAATTTTFAPTITTSLSNSNVLAGSSVNDTATLHNASSTAGGSVAYKVYTDNACTLGVMSAGTVTVTNASVPNSNSIVFNTAGTYYWQAMYSGDSTNATATSSCGSEVLTVTGTSTPPTTGPGTISGNVFNDLNKNDTRESGEPGLSGWTVWLHMAATSTHPWWDMSGWFRHDGYNDPIVATATTDANGNYSFGNLATGTYFVEEQEPTGWDQTSSDMQVILTSGNTSGRVDFANIQKTTTGNGNGNGNGGNGDGWHNGTTTGSGRGGSNDQDDHATSTDHGGTGTTTWNGGNGNWNNGSSTGDNGKGTGGNGNGSDNGNNGNNNGSKNDDNRGNNNGGGLGNIVSHVTNFFHGRGR